MSAKPKVAFFSFTGCEGCQLAVLELEPVLLDILGAVDIVSFREAMTEHSEDYEIAFVEGSISTPHDVEEIQHIRQRAGLVVAIGACACSGGLNALKNRRDMNDVLQTVYGDRGSWFETIPARPVSAVVAVDLELPGCPMDGNEFVWAVKSLLRGEMPRLPQIPVCVECRLKGNVCVLAHKGKDCQGPLTIAGCGAICPSHGGHCVGCRGYLAHPERDAHMEILKEHGLTVDEVRAQYSLFNTYSEMAREATS